LARKGQKGKARTNRTVYEGGSKKRADKRSSRNKTIVIVAICLLVVSGVGYLFLSRGGNAGSASESGGGVVGQEVTTPSGLKYTDEVVGTGPSPKPGQQVTVNYVGTLENGTKFDSSYDRNQPFKFAIGQGRVIKGWDEGVMSMKVGGKRRLVIPSDLGYGPAGSPPKIPGNATLIFEVELLGVG